MDHENLIAIDTHTHAEISCWNPFDNYGEEYDRAADKYFKSSRRPTIQESIDYYRERKIGLVMFGVDTESNLGRRRVPNEEIAEAAQKNSDVMIAFASIDPHKGKMGAREARRLIEEHGVKGFKFHPTMQGYHPYDKMAWPRTPSPSRARQTPSPRRPRWTASTSSALRCRPHRWTRPTACATTSHWPTSSARSARSRPST